MGFIGKQPTSAPLTASDITNDIINADKIADNSISEEHLDPTVITGLSALGSEPADTDEFLISDAGTLKRIDASLVGGGSVELLYSTNAMSGAVFNIDNIFSTNHRVYKIFVDKAYASNDAEFQFNFRSGGSSGSIQNASNYRLQELDKKEILVEIKV